ncbi:predicted protein [Uncinocarpus reesii 1704]|uniref:Uncharacterized protein n=1 Tax=Uncinocarpus reesii (strain UAMH 1704) TaxID=336963 RepID=C4JHD2_UNCRE|nr:uncharacterized protein UREG_01295 [Uncinocarpus reesii 1704]EEP76446.1 predicted protein [Uncinocarpus reesii 1704]
MGWMGRKNDQEAMSDIEVQSECRAIIENGDRQAENVTEQLPEEPNEMEVMQIVEESQDGRDELADIFSDSESHYILLHDEYFLEASRVFEQEKNWSALVSEARDLINDAKTQRIGVFNHFTIRLLGSISDAKDIYSESMGRRQDREDDAEITGKEDEIIQIISDRLSLLMKSKMELASRENFPSLVDEIHGYILPAAIGLLQSCLMAHFLDGCLSTKGTEQLVLMLACFSELCELISPSEIPLAIFHFPDRLKTVRILLRFLLYVFRTNQGNQTTGNGS